MAEHDVAPFGSLLGDPDFQPSPELVERRRLEEQEADRRRVAVDLWIQAYESGQISLRALGKFVLQVTKTLQLSERGRREWLGYVFDRALSCAPPTLGRGNKGVPKNMRAAAVEVVGMVVREGLPLNRASGDQRGTGTAFDRTVQIFEECGITLSRDEVERWYFAAKGAVSE